MKNLSGRGLFFLKPAIKGLGPLNNAPGEGLKRAEENWIVGSKELIPCCRK
jgi:hypothetical protein